MLELRKQIKLILKSYHPRVYYQNAPETTVFPYVVYNFPNSFTDKEQEIFNLDIDVWDNTSDTTAIETLAASLWKGLANYKFQNDFIQFSIYRENRLNELNEDEIGIKRRKLIFQLRYFDRHLLN